MTSTDSDIPADAADRRGLGVAGQVVDERVSDLQRRLFNDAYRDPAAVAALARLRRGAGRPAGSVLDILEFTVSDRFRPGAEPGPSRDENATHLAMTLYALHQQSRSERVHRRDRTLGAALRNLTTDRPPAPITQRFRTLGTADSFAELSHHLRGVVQLLRSGRSEPLDYGRLADQLVVWQSGGRDRIHLEWARGFYRTPRPNNPPTSDS